MSIQRSRSPLVSRLSLSLSHLSFSCNELIGLSRPGSTPGLQRRSAVSVLSLSLRLSVRPYRPSLVPISGYSSVGRAVDCSGYFTIRQFHQLATGSIPVNRTRRGAWWIGGWMDGWMGEARRGEAKKTCLSTRSFVLGFDTRNETMRMRSVDVAERSKAPV